MTEETTGIRHIIELATTIFILRMQFRSAPVLGHYHYPFLYDGHLPA